MSKNSLLASTVFLSLGFATAYRAAAQEVDSPERSPVTSADRVAQADRDPSSDSASDPAAQFRLFKPQGRVITPPISDSTRQGVHLNYKIFVPAGHEVSSAVADYNYAETPASMACVYRVGPNYAGCSPATGGTRHATGGWGAIAVVEAYDDPHIASDVAYFDTYWGLPTANVQVVYANSSFGTLGGGFGPSLTASCSGVPANGNALGWDLEESLDAEWAHAMAPAAKIIVVEACSQNLEDLLYAEEVAGKEVSNAGGGDISNSWGYTESCVASASCNGGLSATQVQDDNLFYRYYYSNISYFASAGDSGSEVLFPSASPWVVSAGGTTVNRDASENFLDETCWSDSGGGSSAVESWQSPPSILNGMGPWSAYQYQLFGQSPRSTPDISFNADPASGVWVYDTDGTCTGFCTVGGTSVSSPALAGIVNAGNNRSGQTPPGGGYYSTQENALLYAQLYARTAYRLNFYDVVGGSNGHAAGTGYDQCTGIGSPRGLLGK